MSKSYIILQEPSLEMQSRNLVQRMKEYGSLLRILDGDARILKSRIQIALLIQELQNRMSLVLHPVWHMMEIFLLLSV